VTVDELRLTDTLVLRGVEWWAESRPGQTPAAGFRVGALEIGGVPMPLGPDGALDPVALNQVLDPFGVQVEAPAVTVEGTRIAVSPLIIRYGDSPLAAGTIGAAYTAVSPTLIKLFNAIQAQRPEAGYLLYAANIVLASLAGLGDFTLKLGGAAVSYEQRSFDDAAAASGTVMPAPAGAEPTGLVPAPGPALGLPAPLLAPSTPGGVTTGAPAGSGLATAPAATRLLDDRVPDVVVLALAVAGLAGGVLLIVARRRRDDTLAGAAT
jgi:hypothetical protein